MTFLKKLKLDWTPLSNGERIQYPYNISSIQNIDEITFDADITFFIGDNGSGKSTLLEAIGDLCGFSIVGGKDLTIKKERDNVSLSTIMRLSWLPKVNQGFYFRAETFDTFSNYIDELAKDPYIGASAYKSYGGKSLNDRSHGQAFLSVFKNRPKKKSLYLLDEPESALSPQNQLVFLRLIWDMQRSGLSQFIIATHSPILMSFPGAHIYQFSDQGIVSLEYENTEHFTLTKDFLNNRERYFRRLFDEEDGFT